MYWPFKATTPSQSEIFSVIVACSYVLTFQGHNTLPKWNIFFKAVIEGTIFSKIFFQSCYCTLIFACMYVLAFQHQYTLPEVKYFFKYFLLL